MLLKDKNATALGLAPSEASLLRKLWRQHRGAVAGLVIVVAFLLTALLAPWFAPYDPTSQDLPNRTTPPGRAHWLGTDHLGRDVLSRLVFGSRISLSVGFLAVGLGAVLGVATGLASGYFGGPLDALLTGVADILLAFPLYLLALTVMAILGRSLLNVVFAVGVASFPSFVRLTRGEVLSVKTRDFVDAARALGSTDSRLLVRHVFPNIVPPLIVMATLRVGFAILVEASLSFLGLGVPPPNPSWGAMVNDGLRLLWSASWVATFPGIAIMMLTLGLNLFGDGLRDALDPTLHGA